MIDYPITGGVRKAIQKFPAISHTVAIPKSGRSKLEIVRLLGDTHYGNIKNLLSFLNSHIQSSGQIGKRIVQQTNPFAFEQALSEIFLFAHLQDNQKVEAKAATTELSSEKNYDIDLSSKYLSAHLEIYCPIDFFGCQLIEKYLPVLFKHLDVRIGFDIDLHLESSVTNGFYAYEVSNNEKTVRNWLDSLNSLVSRWLNNAQVGERRQFAGISDQFHLTVTLRDLHQSAEVRSVRFSGPTKSTDSRLFFEVGQPTDTAASQWGRKLLYKLKERQCGNSEPNFLRLLVVDFSLADTSFPEFICSPKFTERISATINLLVEEAGTPLPYDAVLPARLSQECCFGRIVTLDKWRANEIEELVSVAFLDRPCVPNSFEPASWIEYIRGSAP